MKRFIPLSLGLVGLLGLSTLAPAKAPGGDASPRPKTKIIVHGVTFDATHATIAAEGEPVLDEAARMLAEQPNAVVVVARPSQSAEDTTVDLSGRAQSVRDYLAERGVSGYLQVQVEPMSPAPHALAHDAAHDPRLELSRD